jgi:hypothetical protein
MMSRLTPSWYNELEPMRSSIRTELVTTTTDTESSRSREVLEIVEVADMVPSTQPQVED